MLQLANALTGNNIDSDNTHVQHVIEMLTTCKFHLVLLNATMSSSQHTAAQATAAA
jgi:hypothetical protein